MGSNEEKFKDSPIEGKVENLGTEITPEKEVEKEIDWDLPLPSYKTVVFYYSWYGNPEVNGEYLHWNHQVLVDNGDFFKPPEDIGANFYPMLGTYSSMDLDIIHQHMRQIRSARIGVICISWWGKKGDSQLTHLEGYSDRTIPLLMDIAAKYKLKVCFHHEPYTGRDPLSVRDDISYVIRSYGNHSAFFRLDGKPLFFVYDSYLTKATAWAEILTPTGKHSIRGTDIDAVMISLYLDKKDERLILSGGFDGAYTYFASNGFTFGSTSSQWGKIAKWAREKHKMFIPSVGPGYDDTRIRPWNAKNKKDRQEGNYYDTMWKDAVAQNPSLVTITSFNEWHEGTQLEPAIPKAIPGYVYSDYSPLDPYYYLNKTRDWVNEFDPY